jgi:transcription-repair coupling factor (superfamily II helicase)
VGKPSWLAALKKHQPDKLKSVRSVFWNQLGQLSTVHEIWDAIGQGRQAIVGGVTGSARGLIAMLSQLQSGLPMIVVTSDRHAMEAWEDDLQFWSQWWPQEAGPPPPVRTLPHLETLPYEDREPTVEIRRERGLARELLLQGGNKPSVIVIPVRALMKRQVPEDFLKSHTSHIRPGDRLDREGFARKLVNDGYNYAELVSGPGQFSARGGIIDIYPVTSERPCRIELFDDEVESLRYFDVASQRSTGPAEEVIVLPANELNMTRCAQSEGIELVSLLDLFPPQGRVIVDRLEEVEEESVRVSELVHKMFEQREELLGEEAETELIEPGILYKTPEEVSAALGARADLVMTEFWTDERLAALGKGNVFNLQVRSIEFHQPKTEERMGAILDIVNEGQQVLISCDNDGQATRLADLLWDRFEEQGGSIPEKRRPTAPNGVHLVVGSLDTGFEWPDAGWSATTDRDIFGRYRQFRAAHATGFGVPVVNLMELTPGDYVVHTDHGVARYVGLKLIEVESKRSEFLELHYANEAILYVPIEQVDRVARYLGSEDAPPQLDTLGGKSWDKTKRKAQEAIMEMAQDLLELYAERNARRGHAFSPDQEWQKEFEASFRYVETSDQLKSIAEVKESMIDEKPMDRLLCGDVGFGKTEVAMRAVFKAVMDGRQAAVLAPTTILAQQHTHTFRERMANYPIRIEQLSRFVTPSEQTKVIKGLSLGEVDVVIGTHRILSKDIRFKDLGLVIIDEEQRFGVKHKERLKQLRRMVDCLAMTATPIPRTLYMSLSGIRDISIVNTPPSNRLPIETYVMEWSKPVVEGAILRELARGGQVYFVHNRVEQIGGIAAMVQEIVPDARIRIGHGQMSREQLERVMIDFVAGRFDILVCTTIIESGLDIPNVNTIIINRADHFGLAQMYQLRGRVGRDRHQAYCYLLVPSIKGLSGISRRRLRAIQEYNELGSGFKIAMRDLEIRGMGNILGRHQHGHIAAIGFDLYNKLLNETVEKLQGNRHPLEDMDVVVESDQRGTIPPEYVISSKQRLSIFKRLAGIRRESELKDLKSEIIDMYGSPPPEMERLFGNGHIRIKARWAGIEQVIIREKKGEAELRLGQIRLDDFNPLVYVELDDVMPGEVKLSQKKGSLVLIYKASGVLTEEVSFLLERLKLTLTEEEVSV